MNHRSISFPDWKDTLARAALPPESKAAYTREILTFLRLCKATRSPATVELVKEHLAVREKQSNAPAREALRWFFREGVRQQARPVELVAKKISPQRPAAPFPTHLLDGGADSSTVQELLGHASVETTQIYTHVMHPPSPSYGAARKPGLGVRSPFDSLQASPRATA